MADRSAADRGVVNPSVPLDLATGAMVVVGLLGALAVFAIVRIGADALTVLGVGALVALALDPVVGATRRRFRCSRAVATVIVGFALVLVIGVVVLVLGPQAADQAGRFADELPETIEEFYSWPIIGDRLEEADAVGKAENFVDELPARIDADSIADTAGRLAGGAGATLIVLLTAVAVLLDGDAIVARVRRAIPPDHRDRADEIGRIVYRSIAKYFAGSVTVAILNGLVILTAGLALGVPLAPLAAIWAAITNVIPQIGGFLGGSFFVLLAVTEGALPGAIALAVFLAYQQFENNVIQPTVIGQAVNLTPPTTMLAALIGGAAAGVPGALVATPLIGAVKSVWLDTRGRSAEEPDDSSEGLDIEAEVDGDRPGRLRKLLDKLPGR